MWNLLEGGRNEGISVDNLLRMLTVIRGIDIITESEASFNSTIDGYLSRYCSFDNEGLLQLRQGGHYKLFGHFKNLYINRLQHEGLNKRPVAIAKIDLVKSKPTISRASQRIAEENKEKYHDHSRWDAPYDIVEHLYKKEKLKAEEKKFKMEELKKAEKRKQR